MNVIAPIIVIGLFGLACYYLPFFRIKGIHKHLVAAALAIKIISAICFYQIYTVYYTDRHCSDMYRYFDDAQILHSAFHNEPENYVKMLVGIGDETDEINEKYYMKMSTWFRSYDSFVRNDNRTMIRINAFFRLFSSGSVFVHQLLFLLLSFIGLIWIYKYLAKDNRFYNYALFAAIFFFPSLVFWTSSVVKEAFLIFALGGFIATLSGVFARKKLFLNLIFLPLFVYMLISVKIYVIVILVPVIIARLWSSISQPKFVVAKHLIVFALFISLLWNFQYIFPEMNFVDVFARKQHDFINFAQSIDAGSFIELKKLEPNVWSFLSALPMAFVNILFRPVLFEANSVLMVFASVENLLFIVFLSMTFLSLKRKFKPDISFWGNVFFIVFFFSVVGLSTPVLGAIVRYKIIAYPFLFAMLLSLIDEQLFRKKFGRVLKILHI